MTSQSTPTPAASSLPAPAAAAAERPERKRGKLPKPATDHLEDWLHRHSDNPHPSEDEKKQLSHASGLSMSQVSNWMINVCHFLPRFVLSSRLTLPPSQARRRMIEPAQPAQANAVGSPNQS